VDSSRPVLEREITWKIILIAKKTETETEIETTSLDFNTDLPRYWNLFKAPELHEAQAVVLHDAEIDVPSDYVITQ
jgi:hypothetical protein